MKVSKPKPFADLMAMLSLEPDKWEIIAKQKPVDEKGRYLHWDKFKRIYTTDSELKWLGTKISRSSLLHHIKIGQFSFSFCTPERLQFLLHYIDKNAGGFVGANNLVGLNHRDQNHFLIKSLIMEEAISSAQLEGAATTRKVAKEMLETARKPKTKDEVMILNNYFLMQKVVALKDEALSVEMILKLHRLATNDAIENNAISGEFRKDNDIFIADYFGETIHQLPEHTEINQLMADFCEFANADHSGESGLFIHPVIKAMILHFLIGYIHPFGDGNGRTARAIFYWFMLKNKYWLFEYISISRLLKAAPIKYAKSYLYTETDDLDMTYFLFYQADIIKRAIIDLEKYVVQKQKRMKEFTGVISNFITYSEIKLNSRQIQILEKAVRETGYIFTAKEISNEFGISENTARKDLNVLVKLNLFGQLKTGLTMGYISPNDLLDRLRK